MQSNIKKYRWIFILIALLVLSGFLIWKNLVNTEFQKDLIVIALVSKDYTKTVAFPFLGTTIPIYQKKQFTGTE